MRRIVLDTSVLLRWWNQKRSGYRKRITTAVASRWAQELIRLYETNAIVTPVLIEVVGGTASENDLELMRAYLEPFRCIDEDRILPEDWRDTLRRAQWIPDDRRPRDLGDCLIRAIAARLRHEVETFDQGFPGA